MEYPELIRITLFTQVTDKKYAYSEAPDPPTVKGWSVGNRVSHVLCL